MGNKQFSWYKKVGIGSKTVFSDGGNANFIVFCMYMSHECIIFIKYLRN